MHLRSSVEKPYRGRMWGHELGLLSVISIAGDELVVRRTMRDIAHGDPDVVSVMLQRQGRSCTHHQGQTVVLSPGEIGAFDSSRSWTIEFSEPFDVLCFQVPRSLFQAQAVAFAHGVTDLKVHEKPRRAVFTRLLQQISASLRKGDAAGDDEFLAESTLDLLRGLYATAREPSARSRAGVHQDLQQQIRRSIEARLGDPTLSPDDVARQHFISRRHLYNLFAEDGWKVQQWIRHTRLERARRDLRDPIMRERSIAEIAATWGFAGSTQFCRTFRSVYGCTPREYRAAGASAVPSESAE